MLLDHKKEWTVCIDPTWLNSAVVMLRAGLKLNIQKTKTVASSPITSWQIDRETMETVRDFIFLSPKITADGDCSHEIKRHLLLGSKPIANLAYLKAETSLCQQNLCSHNYGFFSSHVWM